MLETGTLHGGSALCFADLLESGARNGRVVSVDVTHEALDAAVLRHSRLDVLLGDSTNHETIGRIQQLIYSNRVRARRAAAGAAAPVAQEPEPAQEIATRAKSSWARPIKKVYEVDPLECSRCKGPMWVITLINDAEVVQRILKHPGLWAPRQNERAPPAGIEAALPAANVLTYHPVPDIA